MRKMKINLDVNEIVRLYTEELKTYKIFVYFLELIMQQLN